MRKSTALFTLLLLSSVYSYAQTDQPITISGKVTDNHGNDNMYQVVVVNERTSAGTLASPGGFFTVNALHSDTILFSASGFMVKKVCLRDSVYKTHYTITVKLDSLQLSLAEVRVYPTRSLKEIDEDKNRLGNGTNRDKNQVLHAVASPISYLFERFNSMEQSKRKIAALEDEQAKREVLKDLFHLYIKNDIIDLDDNHFDAFIDYLNFSDNFIKTATDYELLMAIKYRYEAFENANSYYAPPAKHRQ